MRPPYLASKPQLHIFHGIGIEGAEKAKQVIDVVHGETVEEDEVLVGRAPAHVKARGTGGKRAVMP